MFPLKIMLKAERFFRDISGATATVFALALPVFAGGLAMAVEVGHWRKAEAEMQIVADMAAIAGARELNFENSIAAVQLAAIGDARKNGFDDSSGTITVHSPPQNGAHAGEPGIEIVVTKKIERAFSGIFSKKPVQVKAQAVALAKKGLSEPACILALDPTWDYAIEVTGSSVIDMPDCSIRTNSNSSVAFYMSGSASVTTSCAYSTGSFSGWPTLTMCDTPVPNFPAMPDPYAHVDVPADIISQPCITPDQVSKKDIALRSGHYCNNGDITGSGNITLEDGGTFVFDGIDLVLKGKSFLYGNNVTLIFMNGGQLENANGGTIHISAKNSGPYSGIAVYNDRVTSDPWRIVLINGNQSSIITGTLYFPTQQLTFSGGASTEGGCTNVVVANIVFTGNTSFHNHCENAGTQEIVSELSGSSMVVLAE